MSKKSSFLPEEEYSPNSAGHSSRIIPERSKSQFVSLNPYQISKEQPSQPIEMEKLPNITDFLTPDDLTLLYDDSQSNLSSETSEIISLLQNSDQYSQTIAENLNIFANELAINGQYLKNVPEFQPKYLGIQDIRARINVSKKFYKIPNSKIYSDIPKIFSLK